MVPVAYVLGSVPFGLLIGLAKGVDPRKAGSGNIGATNVGRLLGGKFFALCFTLDLLKGLLPMVAGAITIHLFQRNNPAWLAGWPVFLTWILVGFAAICGHMFSCFLKFKGGKGVATSAGVLLGLFPYFTWPGLVVIGLFVLLFKLTGFVSLSSIVSAAAFPVAYILFGLSLDWDIFGAQWPLLAFAILVALLIVYKHRTNISRLKAGTEHRFGTPKKEA